LDNEHEHVGEKESREVLPKQTKFRMETENGIFASTLLQPNIRTLEPIEGDLEK
jgi:hypothetical protein